MLKVLNRLIDAFRHFWNIRLFETGSHGDAKGNLKSFSSSAWRLT
jgi:hypothetical protein